MSIQTGMPYKIIASKEKRYDAHYQINAKECLIIPTKILGEEVLCDIHWLDSTGMPHAMKDKMFLTSNLIRLNEMLEPKLSELWSRFHQHGLLTMLRKV